MNVIGIHVCGDHAYVRIPERFRQALGSPCCCRDPNCTSEWDTLAVHDGKSWAVHYPELASIIERQKAVAVDVMRCEAPRAGGGVCGHAAGQGHAADCSYGHPEASPVEQLRSLLMEWEKYARTLASADVTPLPDRLLGRTVGLLDATAV